jgi:hypothetical protein
VARHQQQPRLPGRRCVGDGERRVAVLLGQERPENGRPGEGHQDGPVAGRARSASRSSCTRPRRP